MKKFSTSRLVMLSAVVMAVLAFSSCAESYHAYDDDYGYGYGYRRPYYGNYGYYGYYPNYYSPSYYGYYGWGGYYNAYPSTRYRRSDRYVVRDRDQRNRQGNVQNNNNGNYWDNARQPQQQQKRVAPSRGTERYSAPQRNAPVRSYTPPAGSSSRMSGGSFGGSRGGFGGGAVRGGGGRR